MSFGLSESAIVRVVAEEAARRIARKVISDLQQITDTLSGEDSELTTAWDEICAEVQYEQSLCWDAYDDTVRAIVTRHMAKLPKEVIEGTIAGYYNREMTPGALLANWAIVVDHAGYIEFHSGYESLSMIQTAKQDAERR